MISQKSNPVKNQERLLAIDYGSKYLGLALADGQINIALPFGVIENNGEECVLNELKKFISEKNITKIIIGRPLALSGNVTEQTRSTDQFIAWLKKQIIIPIETFDERFTTKMSKLPDNKKNNAEGHDAAAAIFLQDYLERH